MRGKFITLEGLDGAGKSTQIGWLSCFLEQHGIPLCVTREPGGTATGETLRTLLLDAREPLHPETEALLMFAARREHLDKVIVPALESGTWVLCDRFTDASFAYQGGGSGVAWHKIQALETWVQGSINPDLTLYFDVSPELARTRINAMGAPDRFEREQRSFQERARAAYLRRAGEAPDRIRVVDAHGSVECIRGELEPILRGLLQISRTDPKPGTDQ